MSRRRIAGHNPQEFIAGGVDRSRFEITARQVGHDLPDGPGPRLFAFRLAKSSDGVVKPTFTAGRSSRFMCRGPPGLNLQDAAGRNRLLKAKRRSQLELCSGVVEDLAGFLNAR